MDNAHAHVHTVPHTGDRVERPREPAGAVSLRDARAEFDRVYLSRLLQVTDGNIREAAAIAEIHPKSFERLMRRRGIRRPRNN